MATYISIGEATYPTDTDEQIAEAKEALREAGLTEAPVYAGEPDGLGDSYANGQVLFANGQGIVAAPGCESGEITGFRCDESASATVDVVRPDVRASHQAAGYTGIQSHWGAAAGVLRLRVCPGCADDAAGGRVVGARGVSATPTECPDCGSGRPWAPCATCGRAALSPGEARQVTISAWACRCARCGYEWQALSAEPPGQCPAGRGRGCGAKGWRRPAGPRGLASLSPERRREIQAQAIAARRRP